ncbi:AbiJ-NTD4 domain-containing protein [Candidatus Entotheonella palauensis]|uniref:AbiJ-NTD4 domain-containing protein n=1 Tax=Candidatus Entotheonella palauensis TaxID=93172 RepID=UPI000B7FA6E0|nr:hypothetical protein [Candidatus Entotheonella palauensis]
MSTPYFSDRELGSRPRTNEEISENAWGGIIAAITSFIADGSFGYRYPIDCPDGEGICGCDEDLFLQALRGDIPEFPRWLNIREMPHTLVILDALEFCHDNVAKPIKGKYHQYFDHYHLHFSPDEGQVLFRERINQILSRNGIAYQLEANGRVVRFLTQELQNLITSARFRTGDRELDLLLETARNKFIDRNLETRRESLEKLWDAWERLKTTEKPENKKESIRVLLDKVANEQQFRGVLEDDARILTKIGNGFMIRHSEIGKAPVQSSEQVDYFFHRLFALIHLILRTGAFGNSYAPQGTSL